MDTHSVRLSILPSRGMMDEEFRVLVQNAPPGAQLTLHALHHSEDGHGWEAFAHYTADANGTVNVLEDVSVGGTYSGVEPMGLLWSLRPVPGSKPGLRFRKMDVQTPMVVLVSVYQDHLMEGFVDQVLLAQVQVERWYMAPGVRRIPITEDSLTATLFLPTGPGPFPGVLDLWGGGGQLVEYRSALLALHGFASLALDYLTPKITLEMGKVVDKPYFETAFRVLQQHPQVLSSSIAIIGLSFGSAIALRMAVYSSVIQLRAKTRFTEEGHLIWRDLLLPIPSDGSLKVDVGRLQCPLLLIVGEDDQNWPARESADDMKEMMERAGNAHLLTILSYPNAGHLIEPPYSPHTRLSNFRSTSDNQMYKALWGGETAAHSHAQEDSWRKMIRFLREHLYGDKNTKSHL